MQDFIVFFNHHTSLMLAGLVVVVLLLIIEALRAKRLAFQRSPAQVTQLINRENAVIIDIRPREAFQAGRIIDSHSMQAKDIQSSPKKLDRFKQKPIVIVANHPSDAQKLAAFLIKEGYNAFSLAGGITAWRDAQLPLVKE